VEREHSSGHPGIRALRSFVVQRDGIVISSRVSAVSSVQRPGYACAILTPAMPKTHSDVKATTPTSRRSFLSTGVKGAVAVTALGTAWPACGSDQVRILPFPDTPESALQELIDGNKRWVDKRPTSFDGDLAIIKQGTAEKQEPFAAVLSCADSRVPVELVFDQTVGHLFVVRVAGNIATSEMLASLEYGAAVLGTKVIMVMGHGSCGAVKATIVAEEVPGQISQLFAPIRPAVVEAGPDLEKTIKANAQIQARIVATASPLLARMIKEGKLKVVAGYYDLGKGTVTLLP
jgi:carbonic anhydrase